MDELGGSIRASDLTRVWVMLLKDIAYSLSDEPFMEDNHIKGGGGVRDEVTKHVHLCNRIFQ